MQAEFLGFVQIFEMAMFELGMDDYRIACDYSNIRNFSIAIIWKIEARNFECTLKWIFESFRSLLRFFIFL